LAEAVVVAEVAEVVVVVIVVAMTVVVVAVAEVAVVDAHAKARKKVANGSQSPSSVVWSRIS
jgi:hypothetical protein